MAARDLPAEGSALQVNDLWKRYGSGQKEVVALRGVDLQVGPREIVALLGNNGAGKSTLMSICAGVLTADSGTVLVHGASSDQHRRVGRSPVGLAPQEESLYPTLTVRQNLTYFGRIAGLRGGELADRAANVASSLQITELLDRTASTLSGGQRRRLHTGIALMHEPTVILLDEPTVGVDIDARADLLRFVSGLATAGAAVLYSTHQLNEVEAIADRVVVIDAGRILASGTAESLVSEHSRHVAEFVFDSESVDMMDAPIAPIHEMDRLPAGAVRIGLSLERPDVHVGELVDALSDRDRKSLVSASVRGPSLESAYLEITRQSRAAGDAYPALGEEAT